MSEFYTEMHIKTHLANALYLSSLQSDLSMSTEQKSLSLQNRQLVPPVNENVDVCPMDN